MSTTLSRSAFLTALGATALLGLAPARAHAQAAAADPPHALLKKMLEAIKAKSYDDFMIECDDKMRAALTKPMFEGVANMMAARLRDGYKTPYLGKLRQQGHIVYLWKLEPADGKDEVLVKVSMKDGKVGGFLLQ